MHINCFAVLAAAASAFVLGVIWYSPLLFYEPRLRANGFTDADVQKGSPAVVFGLSFVFSLVMALNLAAFLGAPDTTPAQGVSAGALTGFGGVALGIGVIALVERRPWSYIVVNGAYWGVAPTIMGAIPGGWR